MPMGNLVFSLDGFNTSVIPNLPHQTKILHDILSVKFWKSKMKIPRREALDDTLDVTTSASVRELHWSPDTDEAILVFN